MGSVDMSSVNQRWLTPRTSLPGRGREHVGNSGHRTDGPSAQSAMKGYSEQLTLIHAKQKYTVTPSSGDYSHSLSKTLKQSSASRGVSQEYLRSTAPRKRGAGLAMSGTQARDDLTFASLIALLQTVLTLGLAVNRRLRGSPHLSGIPLPECT